MKTISPWINFNGNADEAFHFYQSVLGGEFTKIVRFKDVADDGVQIAEQDAEKIMQIILSIGDTHELIGNDVPEFMGKVNESENRSKIYLGVDSKEEAEKICTGLSVGGKMEVPIDTSAAEVFAMFRDKYGIEWIIEYNPTA
jgi:PhnB protein